MLALPVCIRQEDIVGGRPHIQAMLLELLPQGVSQQVVVVGSSQMVKFGVFSKYR